MRFSTIEITEEDYELLMEAKKVQSELDAPQWAVITSRGVTATGLTYAEASDMADKMRGLNESGLTIVTAAVAERLGKSNDAQVD